MRTLIYSKTGDKVKVGDIVKVFEGDDQPPGIVMYWNEDGIWLKDYSDTGLECNFPIGWFKNEFKMEFK